MDQADRFTEVFLQDDVTREQITKAEKNSGAKIDVHPSKDSHHISKHGINKGTAILELATLKHWGDDYRIAVGDADMDIPMFERVHYSFAVGNSSKGAKAAAKKVLKGKYEKGVKEIYDLVSTIRP